MLGSVREKNASVPAASTPTNDPPPLLRRRIGRRPRRKVGTSTSVVSTMHKRSPLPFRTMVFGSGKEEPSDSYSHSAEQVVVSVLAAINAPSSSASWGESPHPSATYSSSRIGESSGSVAPGSFTKGFDPITVHDRVSTFELPVDSWFGHHDRLEAYRQVAGSPSAGSIERCMPETCAVPIRASPSSCRARRVCERRPDRCSGFW